MNAFIDKNEMWVWILVECAKPPSVLKTDSSINIQIVFFLVFRTINFVSNHIFTPFVYNTRIFFI